MRDDELTAPIDRLFTPQATRAQAALARLEAIADYLEAAPLGELDTDNSSIRDTAIAIRQCVDVLKRALM